MKVFRVAFLFLLCLSWRYTTAQKDTVVIKITIVDGFTHKSLPGVSVINRKSGIIINTDINGFAEVRTSRHDDLYVFLSGYHAAQVYLLDSALKEIYVLHLTIEPFSTGLDRSVVIKAPKTLDRIGEDRRKLGIVPKEVQKPRFNPILNPLFALYEAVSRKGKERRTLKKEILANDKRKVFKELLNYYNEKKIISLPEELYDDFIDFCNLPDTYLKTHNDYDLMKGITNLYTNYSAKKGLVK